MLKKSQIFVLVSLLAALGSTFVFASEKGDFFAGQDIHLAASNMIVFPAVSEDSDKQVIIFEKDFSLAIGSSLVTGDRALVWLDTKRSQYRGAESVDYDVRVYLEGNVRAIEGKGAKATEVKDAVIEKGQSLVVHFFVSGEVFATADEVSTGILSALGSVPIYQRAVKAARPLRSEPRIAAEAMVPQYKDNITYIQEKFGEPVKNPLRVSEFFEIAEIADLPDSSEDVAESPSTAEIEEVTPPQEQGEYRYPVNISGLWQQEPELQTQTLPDDSKIATLIGRFYLWQKKDEKGGLIEFQADNGVIFYGGQDAGKDQDDEENKSDGDMIDAVYFRGNIIMTEGSRTIRADELFYDFANHRALVVKAEMRKFDAGRGIPIYIRAAKLQQVSENVFKGEQIVITPSEFYLPQISLTASQLVMTDLTGIDERPDGVADDSKYDAVLSDIRMKVGKSTVFAWPGLRTNFERPDLPIRRASLGHDSDFGTLVETQWYLSRILGLKEPDGVDSSLLVDYLSKRGEGVGVVIDYARQDYFGGVSAYIINDRGQDDLGRTRENIEPEEKLRGRFTARHRHYLPYDWQATVETSYISDRNFLESYFRTEFNTSKAQETLLHLKRLRDNWAFAFLTKIRINDFESELEEIPTIDFHLKGQSFWENRLTYYGDTRISRLRNRIPDDSASTPSASQQFYTFFTTRHEVDMPLTQGALKLVPFVAGTYSIEDQDGFQTDIDNSTSTDPENKTLLGEGGVRLSTMFWKQYPTIYSEFWDVDGIRHIVKPHAEAVAYSGSDDVIDMRDFVNLGLSQRWQTHRGRKERKRTLDWMRLDVDATFLSDREDDSLAPPVPNSYGPARFIWNDPSIPMFTRRDDTLFGMVRDTINSEYLWRISDTTMVLSDLNYDTETGVIQQFNVGLARYIYPDISYYIGSRYLRPSIVSVPSEGVYEEGSNSVIGSITYALNNRYTLIFSEEYNFDYGKNVRTEIALLRRYHRVFYGLTLSVDESRDESSIVFSIWPQGIKDLTFGNRKYASFRDGILED